MKKILCPLLCFACAVGGTANADSTAPTNAAQSAAITKDLSALSLSDLLQTEFDTVYGASKHEQKISEAPAAVTVLTAEDIKQYGWRSLGDVLRSVRGFYVAYDRSYEHVGARGINRPGDYGGRFLINIDGHRMNDPLYDSAAIGLDLPLDVDLIERVEIIRGPASSLYGDNAFLVIVNIITRRGQNMNGGEVSAATSSYNAYNWRASYGKQFTNGVNLLLSGSWRDSDGHDRLFFPEFASVNNGYAEHLDAEHVRQAFASVSYGDFSLEALYGYRKKSAPPASYGALFNVGPDFDSDERAFVELKYAHEFDHGWNLHARTFFDHYYYEGLGPYDDPDAPGHTRFSLDRGLARYWGGELQLDKTFWEHHHVTLGAELHDDLKLRQKTEYLDPVSIQADVSSKNNNYGCYVQDEYALLKNLTLNAGVRCDYYESFGSTVNPRAGLIWNPFSSSTFKLLYGQAYRAPNAYERDYLVYGFAHNSQLNPETIQAYELVWEQRLTQPLRLTASLFYDDIHDLIAEQAYPDGTVQFQNTDNVVTRGAEVELEGRWAKGWRSRLSYMLAVAEDPGIHATLNNSPRHLAKLNLVAPLYADKVFLGFELQGMSGRTTLAGNQTSAFAVANVTLFSRELVKGLEVSASIYNLFNKRYADPVGAEYTPDTIMQDGRTFQVKLTYHF